MGIEGFIKLVREMRRAQLDYYMDRKYSKLVAAKDLERKVDTVLRQGIDPQLDFVEDQRPNVPEQKPLFTEGEP